MLFAGINSADIGILSTFSLDKINMTSRVMVLGVVCCGGGVVEGEVGGVGRRLDGGRRRDAGGGVGAGTGVGVDVGMSVGVRLVGDVNMRTGAGAGAGAVAGAGA